ncbi:MAG TPA: cupin domain-containing protein [Kiritimatiellia bacterium]|nr:cupin domain-containing protein [Kiritimatiellia bacterium]
MNAVELIRQLDLQPHPEGGWFRETYRSGESVDAAGLPARYGAPRALSTAIYFLLEAGQFSAFHRLRSDEAWFHHAGGTLDVWRIDPQGILHIEQLGPDAGRWQLVIPRGDWFAARPAADAPFVLIGCTVAPGFDFADFELAEPAALADQFPAYRDCIEQLTRS